MENVQGKKPAEWFAQLKEPYKSQAIAAIDKNFSLYEEYPESLKMALNNSINHIKHREFIEVFDSIVKGEKTYLEPEIVSLINEVNNIQVTEQQNQIESEKVEIDYKAKFEQLQKRYEVLVTEAHKLDVLSGEMCDKYTELKQQIESQTNQEKVYIFCNYESNEWSMANELQTALKFSKDEHDIYEAVKIGVKKSVLVNEN